MNTRKYIAAALLAAATLSAPAQEWIDTSDSDSFLTFGARVGFNTANATRGGEGTKANLDSWGTGFNAGVIASINFNKAVSVQPGFFFQSRSHNYSYVTPVPDQPNMHEYGHTLYRTFQVPIMGVFTLHPGENLAWSFEFGPYFQFGLSGSDKGTYEVALTERAYKDGYFDHRKKFDFGFKFGTGVTVLEHYYLGLHYEAGTCSVWEDYGGRNKAWSFTVGYNF